MDGNFASVKVPLCSLKHALQGGMQNSKIIFAGLRRVYPKLVTFVFLKNKLPLSMYLGGITVASYMIYIVYM